MYCHEQRFMTLITFNPVINCLREVSKNNTGSLSSEVLDLIIPPSVNQSQITYSPNVNTQDYIENDSSEEEISDRED